MLAGEACVPSYPLASEGVGGKEWALWNPCALRPAYPPCRGVGGGRAFRETACRDWSGLTSLPDSPATEENPGEDPGPVSDPCGRRDRAVKSARSLERGRGGGSQDAAAAPRTTDGGMKGMTEAERLSRRRALEGKSLLISLASQNLAEPNGSLSTLTHRTKLR